MKSYYLAVADHDRRQFSIYGPMADDKMLQAQVYEATTSGRQLKLVNSGTKNIEREMALSEAVTLFPGYLEIPPVIG